MSGDLGFCQRTKVLPWKQDVKIGHTAEIHKTEEARLLCTAILESFADAIISKDLNGVISYWNSAAWRTFGYTKDEAVGQPISIIVPPDLRYEQKDVLKRLRAGERIERETRRVSKYGRILNVSITISPLRDSEGGIIGAVKSGREISERYR